MKILALFGVVIAFVSAIDLEHKDCGSTAKIVKVFSDDCSEAVCKLHKGSSYSMQISFIPAGEVKALKASLAGVIAGVELPFPLPEPDGCKALVKGSCPISEGTEVTFKEALKVEPSYPALKVTSRWRLGTPDNKKFLCVDIPVIIVS